MKKAKRLPVDKLPISKKQTIAIRNKDVRMLWRKGYNKVEIAKYMGISRITVASILASRPSLKKPK